MFLEDAVGDLRKAADRLFDLIQHLTGERPRPQTSGQWYTVGTGRKAILSLKLRGPTESKADRYPPNSIVVKAGWDESLAFDWVERRSDDQKARFVVAASDPTEIERAEEFIRRALGLRSSKDIDRVSFPTYDVTFDSEISSPTAADLDVPPADRVETTVLRIVRDTELANWVKRQHNHCCQLCGETIRLADGSGYAEGHHLQPLGKPHDGPDEAGNVLCVCPNHHAACDFGAIKLNPREISKATDHKVSEKFIAYHNEKIYRGRRK